MKVRLLAAAAVTAALALPAVPANATIRMCQEPADAGCFAEDSNGKLVSCVVYVAGYCLTQVKGVSELIDIGG